MKRFLLIGLMGLLIVSSGQTVFAYTITDDYWGGTPVNTGNQDTIGTPHFNINGMDVVRGPDFMEVKIYGDYFHYRTVPSTLADDFTPGDLFIDTGGWTVTGTPYYETDEFDKSEGWNYVVTPDGVFDLTDYMETNAPANYAWRKNQAWVYQSPATNAPNPIGQTIAYSFHDDTTNYANSYLYYKFSTTNMASTSSNWGFHWTMQCGNDVIEGGTPVPEPATLLLFGIGLIGIRMASRRKIN